MSSFSDPAPTRKVIFRTDINGLRAWAVLLVVFYHFRVPGFQGGFVGVDVFFVISGFLMTGIIVRGLEGRAAPFSVIDFYLARARRIIPALAALSLVLLIFGWMFLAASDFRQLGVHAATANTFVSNIQFWRESGYFDVASHEKWLLHTWSLSVEWQFYMLLPVAVLGIWRLWPNRRALSQCMVAALVCSLALSATLTPTRQVAAFYLLPTRAWEMLAGGLVFLFPLGLAASRTSRWVLEILGFMLILASAVAIDPKSPWPGWLAVVPVAGTALVLLADRNDSVLTGNRTSQWMGDASYSIYLWHWPLVVLLLYVEQFTGPLSIVVGICASLALGRLSWTLVEQPGRALLTRLGRRGGTVAATALVLVASSAGVAVYVFEGVPGRMNPQVEQAFSEARNLNPRRSECHLEPPESVPECTYGSGPLGAIVLGDSHAASFVRSIEAALGTTHAHVLDWTYSGCPTLLRAWRQGQDKGVGHGRCREFVQYALTRSKELDAAPLFIINRSSIYLFGPNEVGREPEFGQPLIYFDQPTNEVTSELIKSFKHDMVDTLCKFAQQRPTFVVRPIPELKVNVPRAMGRSIMFGWNPRVSIGMPEYAERHRAVWEAQDEARDNCGVRILDPLPYLCNSGRCWGDVHGAPVYFDDNHLSERGGTLLLPMLREALGSRDSGSKRAANSGRLE